MVFGVPLRERSRVFSRAEIRDCGGAVVGGFRVASSGQDRRRPIGSGVISVGSVAARLRATDAGSRLKQQGCGTVH